MRSLFLLLLLANLLALAAQFEPVRDLIRPDARPAPKAWLHPEKLRIVRDTSRLRRPGDAATSQDAVDQASGTKN